MAEPGGLVAGGATGVRRGPERPWPVVDAAGVAYVGRANENVEQGYAAPPTSPLVSGSPDSLLPFADLGQQGRRFVTDVVTPELIQEVMGEEAAAHPIRAYVAFNSEPLYQSGRAELGLAEPARTGAFDRSVLLLVSPTGTGWVDHTLIEAAEFLTRGDIATCCVQYGRYPSFLSVQKVALGQSQFRLLLWGIRQRRGTVGVFDRHEQFQGLSDEARARLRAVVLSHDNDPIAVLGPELMVQRPPWLATDGARPRGARGDAMDPSGHLRPDGHGRGQRDGVGAG